MEPGPLAGAAQQEARCHPPLLPNHPTSHSPHSHTATHHVFPLPLQLIQGWLLQQLQLVSLKTLCRAPQRVWQWCEQPQSAGGSVKQCGHTSA